MAGKRGRPRKHPAQEVKEEIKKILDEPKIANIKLSEEDAQLIETIKSNEAIIKKENDKVDGHRKISRICQRSQQPQHDQHHIIGGIP